MEQPHPSSSRPRVLAIIPARGGSKGVPRKNIKPLIGKPLIAYTIETAKRSVYLTRTIVSTDDQEIAEVAKANGGDVPFYRPAYLAADTSPTSEAVLHAIETLKQQGETYDLVVILQPTTPLRSVEDIDIPIQRLLEHSTARSSASVAKIDDPHPRKIQKITPDGFLQNYIDGPRLVRRQDAEPAYRWSGSTYVAYVADVVANNGQILIEPVLPYVMPDERSVNIDCLLDFFLCEKILEQKQPADTKE